MSNICAAKRNDESFMQAAGSEGAKFPKDARFKKSTRYA